MRAYVRAALGSKQDALGAAEIVEASGGFEALRLLPRGPYDVVITDVNMPDINGLELLQFIRNNSQHKGTPVLLISTQTSQKDRERGLALGANDYIEKPFTIDTLRDAVLKNIAPESQSPDG